MYIGKPEPFAHTHICVVEISGLTKQYLLEWRVGFIGRPFRNPVPTIQTLSIYYYGRKKLALLKWDNPFSVIICMRNMCMNVSCIHSERLEGVRPHRNDSSIDEVCRMWKERICVL